MGCPADAEVFSFNDPRGWLQLGWFRGSRRRNTFYTHTVAFSLPGAPESKLNVGN